MLIDDLVDPDVLDPTGHLAANDAHIDALLEHVASRVAGGIAGRQLLEVGCSDGWNLLTAVGRGALAWGVDTSAALLWLGRDRLPDADFRLGSPEELPFDSASFDVVCRFGITADGRDLAASVGEMARVCRRGGVIAVTVTGEDDEDAGQRAAAVVRIAANLGVAATLFDTAAQVSNVETIPVMGVILTR
jgi:ubiquinone/menaquinone biosynthesis C-methylase UbiE